MTKIAERSLTDMPELLQAALDRHRASGPSIAAFHDPKFSRHIMLSLDDGSVDQAFLYIGPDHVASRIFGEKFRKTAIGVQGLPDREFNDAVNDKYYEVSWTGKPGYEFVRGKCGDYRVDYYRLILPVEDDKRKMFANFISVERMARVPSTPCGIVQLESPLQTGSLVHNGVLPATR